MAWLPKNQLLKCTALLRSLPNRHTREPTLLIDEPQVKENHVPGSLEVVYTIGVVGVKGSQR